MTTQTGRKISIIQDGTVFFKSPPDSNVSLAAEQRLHVVFSGGNIARINEEFRIAANGAWWMIYNCHYSHATQSPQLRIYVASVRRIESADAGMEDDDDTTTNSGGAVFGATSSVQKPSPAGPVNNSINTANNQLFTGPRVLVPRAAGVQLDASSVDSMVAGNGAPRTIYMSISGPFATKPISIYSIWQGNIQYLFRNVEEVHGGNRYKALGRVATPKGTSPAGAVTRPIDLFPGQSLGGW